MITETYLNGGIGMTKECEGDSGNVTHAPIAELRDHTFDRSAIPPEEQLRHAEQALQAAITKAWVMIDDCVRHKSLEVQQEIGPSDFDPSTLRTHFFPTSFQWTENGFWGFLQEKDYRSIDETGETARVPSYSLEVDADYHLKENVDQAVNQKLPGLLEGIEAALTERDEVRFVIERGTLAESILQREGQEIEMHVSTVASDAEQGFDELRQLGIDISIEEGRHDQHFLRLVLAPELQKVCQIRILDYSETGWTPASSIGNKPEERATFRLDQSTKVIEIATPKGKIFVQISEVQYPLGQEPDEPLAFVAEINPQQMRYVSQVIDEQLADLIDLDTDLSQVQDDQQLRAIVEKKLLAVFQADIAREQEEFAEIGKKKPTMSLKQRMNIARMLLDIQLMRRENNALVAQLLVTDSVVKKLLGEIEEVDQIMTGGMQDQVVGTLVTSGRPIVQSGKRELTPQERKQIEAEKEVLESRKIRLARFLYIICSTADTTYQQDKTQYSRMHSYRQSGFLRRKRVPFGTFEDHIVTDFLEELTPAAVQELEVLLSIEDDDQFEAEIYDRMIRKRFRKGFVTLRRAMVGPGRKWFEHSFAEELAMIRRMRQRYQDLPTTVLAEGRLDFELAADESSVVTTDGAVQTDGETHEGYQDDISSDSDSERTSSFHR